MTDPIKDVNNTAAAVPPAPTPGQGVPSVPTQGTPSTPAPKVEVPSTPDVKPSVVPLQALHEERSKRQALEAEISQLKAQQQYSQQPYQQPPADYQAQQQNQLKEELDRLWETDPRKAVETTVSMYADWRDKVEANVEMQATQLSLKHSDFNNYRAQAMGILRTMPLQQRAQPGAMEWAYYTVRGQNVDQILEQQRNELYQKFQAGQMAAGISTPTGTYTQPFTPPNSVQLSQEQLNVAAAMNLSPEQYASQIRAAK